VGIERAAGARASYPMTRRRLGAAVQHLGIEIDLPGPLECVAGVAAGATLQMERRSTEHRGATTASRLSRK
jgi:hypothetical protein